MNNTTYTASTMLLLGLSVCAANAQTSQKTAVEPLSTSMFSCAASGQGDAYMKICVSKQGNVVSFESPQGHEHIRVGEVLEGYIVCGRDKYRNEYELYNYGKESKWADAYKVQQPNGRNTFPLTLYSKSSDLELVQTFTRDAGARQLTITMRVYNRAGEPMGIARIKRGVDFDINQTPGDDVFVQSGKTILATDLYGQYGGMSFTGPGSPQVYTYRNSQNYGGWCFNQDPGGWGPEPTPTAPGDYVAVNQGYFNAVIPNNSFVEAKFVYRAVD